MKQRLGFRRQIEFFIEMYNHQPEDARRDLAGNVLDANQYIAKHLRSIITDTKIIEAYKEDIPAPNHVLINLITHEYTTKSGLLVQDDSDTFYAWMSMGYVVNSGHPQYKVGSVVKLPNELEYVEINPEYESYEKQKKAYPADMQGTIPPPRYLGSHNMYEWIKSYAYRGNPYLPGTDTVVLVPHHHIQGVMDRKRLLDFCDKHSILVKK